MRLLLRGVTAGEPENSYLLLATLTALLMAVNMPLGYLRSGYELKQKLRRWRYQNGCGNLA
jgi:hypothetical protein